MEYFWDPDLTLRILDPRPGQLTCQSGIWIEDEGVLRCTRRRSEKAAGKAWNLLELLSQQPPSDVCANDLKTLAKLCLCADHKGDKEALTSYFQLRLGGARCLYDNFKKVNTRFTTFRSNVCNKLGTDENQPDESLVDTIQRLKSSVSSGEKNIASLRGKLWAEQKGRKVVESQTEEHKRMVVDFQELVKEHENQSKDSELRVAQLEEKLESAEAQGRLLEETCERGETRIRQQDAELTKLKFEIASRDASNQELQKSVANLQAQVQETQKLEKALQDRIGQFQQVISQNETQARMLQQSNTNRQAQLETMAQTLSKQIQALTSVNVENLAAAEKLATTTTQINTLELANAELQSRIDMAREVADIEDGRTRKTWIRSFTQRLSRSSHRQQKEDS